MDMSNLLILGAKAFMNSKGSGNAGSGLDLGTLTSALSGLSNSSGSNNFDIGSLIGGMQGGGMGGLLNSWLGDGDNQEASGNQISDMLGSDKISAFASKLGLSESEAIGGLQDAIPQMVDNGSSGGNLLDSLGGAAGMLNMANSFFGK
jgi:uncharacterized protein YidB (DUF937 family)